MVVCGHDTELAERMSAIAAAPWLALAGVRRW
jgi:hypothetical protein